MNASKIVTIKKKIPLFKDEVRANSVELIELVEIGNQIVSGIGLFEVGDKALFIEPDYCIPDIPLFEEYHRPNGNVKKSKLGTNGRIRAIKFNLHTGDGEPIFSYGILIPFNKLEDIVKPKDYENLDSTLGIFKCEEEVKGLNLPNNLYKADETNINNLWNYIEYPITLIGTEKVDGQSITITCKTYSGSSYVETYSRTKAIPLFIDECIGIRKYTFIEKVKKLLGGKEPDRRILKKISNINDKYLKSSLKYANSFAKYCLDHKVDLALRGELYGEGVSGGNNKNNPYKNDKIDIKFYAVDDYKDKATRLDENHFNSIVKDLNLDRCKVYFKRKMRCKGDIIKLCNEIFKKEKANGRLIEGIVVKTLDGKFSAKLMNLEYDSKK